ncbi:MAG: stage 0 sporulation family protein [Clostridia bacterium]|nr:stage 0 sporulation family protein [Clostridia bacterium]
MVEIVGVRFKKVGKIYYFDPCKTKFEESEYVIVETQRGIEIGVVVLANRQVEDGEISVPLKPVIRKATEADLKQEERNVQKEKEAFYTALERIKKHNLDMKLIDTEYTFDGGKLLFYFTADGRVDFRDLVKDLASIFRTRIELRQIGVRDEAKMLGGLGVCGRRLCCNSFLGEFIPVSIKMAKEQSLSLNPTKISGTCGRLMCCLKYEQDTYDALAKDLPGYGALVKTPDGEGSVVKVEILQKKIGVKLSGDHPPKEYLVDEIKILKNTNKKVEDVSADELKELKKLEEI